jgi:hypothetical protein
VKWLVEGAAARTDLQLEVLDTEPEIGTIFCGALTSAVGPTRTCRDVCYLTAFGGKADISQPFAEPVWSKNSSEAPSPFTLPPDGNNARVRPVARGIEQARRADVRTPRIVELAREPNGGLVGVGSLGRGGAFSSGTHSTAANSQMVWNAIPVHSPKSMSLPISAPIALKGGSRLSSETDFVFSPQHRNQIPEIDFRFWAVQACNDP